MTWKSTEKRIPGELPENSATVHSQRVTLERLGKGKGLLQVLILAHCPGEMIAGFLGQDRFQGYNRRKLWFTIKWKGQKRGSEARNKTKTNPTDNTRNP